MDEEYKKTIETYNLTAEEYSQKTKEIPPTMQIEKFVKLLKGKSVLDIGCATGRDTIILHNKGLDIIGVDLSESMINIAKQSYPHIDFHVMDLLQLDFNSEMFDGVYCNATFLHIKRKDSKKAFDNIHNILKKGGIFFVSIKGGDTEEVIIDSRYEKYNEKFFAYYEIDEFISLAKRSNFELIEYDIRKKETSSYNTHDFINFYFRKN